MPKGELTGKIIESDLEKAKISVSELISQGAQGEIYVASAGGQKFALKWYTNINAAPTKEHIQGLASRGAPDERFVWPIALAFDPEDQKRYGYVMPLLGAKFKGITGLMTRKVEPTFRALTIAAANLADAFLKLHINGFCYRDISNGNVLFDPEQGDIRIIDNDNVTVNKDENATVLGTPRYMAPEIVCGQSSDSAPIVYPSTQTDLYSLSVLLFYMLFIHHPLEGRKEWEIHAMDIAAMNKLFGKEPVYIFDPEDKSNRPVMGEQDNPLIYRDIYPQFVLELFERAFTDGIRDPINGRIEESTWRNNLILLHDSIIYCSSSSCQAENFYDREKLKKKLPLTCWSCGKTIPLPSRLKIGSNYIIMLTHSTRLYPHHLIPMEKGNLSKPLATVNPHPSKPGLFGLKNETSSSWFISTGKDAVKEVAPGRSLNLTKNMKINFGTADGEIRV